MSEPSGRTRNPYLTFGQWNWRARSVSSISRPLYRSAPPGGGGTMWDPSKDLTLHGSGCSNNSDGDTALLVCLWSGAESVRRGFQGGRSETNVRQMKVSILKLLWSYCQAIVKQTCKAETYLVLIKYHHKIHHHRHKTHRFVSFTEQGKTYLVLIT